MMIEGFWPLFLGLVITLVLIFVMFAILGVIALVARGLKWLIILWAAKKILKDDS